MRKEIGLFIAGASLVLGGCSTVEQATPKPSPTSSFSSDNNILVDCRPGKGPIDEPYKEFTLKLKQSVKFGGITKDGVEERVRLQFDNTGLNITPETNGLQAVNTPTGGIELSDSNIIMDIEGIRVGDNFTFGVSATCILEAPQAPGPLA